MLCRVYRTDIYAMLNCNKNSALMDYSLVTACRNLRGRAPLFTERGFGAGQAAKCT